MSKKEKVEYQTFLVQVNLDNVQSNYETIIDMGEQLLVMDDYDLKITLKNNFYYHDKIDWDNVDLSKIRESLADMI